MKFLCSQCGLCCKLAGFLKSTKDVLPINKDGSCSNLIDNKCSIYEDRPDICRVEKMISNKDNLSRKDYYIKSTKVCHTLIDTFGLEDSYKIDIKEYDKL
jgi:Fe-S-cluster containining protein|tara:strand:+ start:521 stop:820 length:300 start_codon:yes stop_codon:yes gene_type:complete